MWVPLNKSGVAHAKGGFRCASQYSRPARGHRRAAHITRFTSFERSLGFYLVETESICCLIRQILKGPPSADERDNRAADLKVSFR